MLHNTDETMKIAAAGAEKLGMSVDEFEKSMSEAGYRVPELV